MKKFARYTLSLLMIIAVVTLCATVFAGCNRYDCDLEIDYSNSQGEIMHGATGFLYGLAEPDVPSGQLLGTLYPQIAAVKAPDGLQHPMGDVLQVGATFIENGGGRLFVYMQDIYPDWYYVYKGIDDYLAKIDEMMPKLISYEYADKIILCPFNENDNGEWYGNFNITANRKKFFDDWKSIYGKIKSYDSHASIAGPGFINYNRIYITDFLNFCLKNDCMPDVMVWHELGGNSYRDFEKNFDDYRRLERKLGISALEICISEYGEMSSNGLPGETVQYISMFEKAKVNACTAYWRLANNLSELAADNNTPTSAWWVYHWYGQMCGDTYLCDVKSKTDMRAVSSYDASKNKIEILIGDGGGAENIRLKNLNSIPTFKNSDDLCVDIEYVDFAGLGGECLSPSKLSREKVKCSEEISIKIRDTSKYRAYKITVTDAQGDLREIESDFTNRYEAEAANVSGNSNNKKVIKNPTYAASGKLVKGISNDAKLNFNIEVPSDGKYLIKICYANGFSLDGSPDSRANIEGHIEIDGASQSVLYENTLSDVTSAMKCVEADLKQGRHAISLFGDENIAYDFIDVTLIGDYGKPYVFKQDGKAVSIYDGNANTLMFVVPSSGYYNLTLDCESEVYFHETYLGVLRSCLIYMEKGINFVHLDGERSGTITAASQSVSLVTDVAFSYREVFASNGRFVSGSDNFVEFKINVADGGLYALNLDYASNQQIGEHAYNVQQVERYAVLEINGVKQTIYFRSTYSWETYLVKTVYVNLAAGENTVKLYNDGSYAWNGNTPYMPVFDCEKISYAKARLV
ncbi:MAG: hypothetical protein NC037_00365 [Bacteroides sp.]|nr:hypothetical protein [Bacillota bacterium]MCM1393624.1 hypothetical protein [[Eubacterium] siraeum]MCM1454970.1 hypothetical protein [Bacteroides sp.]